MLKHAASLLAAGLSFATFAPSARAETPRPRARDLGVPFPGTPGPKNAITDVAGVEVGFTTLVSGDGKLVVGSGPVRTGVTAVLPRGKASRDAVFAGWFSQNGNGEMTGTTWVKESGFLAGPVMITNTHSVGVVRDAVIAWEVARDKTPLMVPSDFFWSLPVVAETWDGELNDINGFHVKEPHVFAALDGARGGAVAEGNVGGGTAMTCYGFKGGTGTASRVVKRRGGAESDVVGVLVQCNCGARRQLTIAGVPVGLEIPLEQKAAGLAPGRDDVGSIIIVVATDAPLLPHQVERLARRATMGLARTGSVSGNGSGDIFIAFSTANAGAGKETGTSQVTMLANDDMNPLFGATAEATEEAIVNAMVAAETMVGANGLRVEALPHDRLREALRKYGRLSPTSPSR
jgi:L-aminopeptidase/D-esterase-like protein